MGLFGRKRRPPGVSKQDIEITKICLDLVGKDGDADALKACTIAIRDMLENKRSVEDVIAEISKLTNKPMPKVYKKLKKVASI